MELEEYLPITLRVASQSLWVRKFLKKWVHNRTFFSKNDIEIFKFFCRHGKLSTVKHIVNNCRDSLPIDYALEKWADKGNLEGIRFLMESENPCITIQDDTLNNCLCRGAKQGHLEMVKYLVSRGANVRIKDDYPCRYASKNGCLEVVKYLVSCGADPNAMNGYGFRHASSMLLNMVKYLVSQGVDPRVKNNYAIKNAARNRALEILKYLFNLVTPDKCLWRELMKKAALSGRLETIIYLSQIYDINLWDNMDVYIVNLISKRYSNISKFLYEKNKYYRGYLDYIKDGEWNRTRGRRGTRGDRKSNERFLRSLY